MTKRFKRACVRDGVPACYMHLDIIHRPSGRKLDDVITADAERGVIARYKVDGSFETEEIECPVDIVAGPSYPQNVLDVNLHDDIVAGVIYDEDLTQADRDYLAKDQLAQFDTMPDLAHEDLPEISGIDIGMNDAVPDDTNRAMRPIFIKPRGNENFTIVEEVQEEVGRITFQGRNHDNDVIQPIHFENTGVATAIKEMDRVRREIAEATLVVSPRFEVRPGQGGFVIKASTGSD